MSKNLHSEVCLNRNVLYVFLRTFGFQGTDFTAKELRAIDCQKKKKTCIHFVITELFTSKMNQT